MDSRICDLSFCVVVLLIMLPAFAVAGENELDKDLIGYWKLQSDCQDYSGQEHHGINRGVDFVTGEFNGRGSYIEVPDAADLQLGRRPFSVTAWVYTERDHRDVIGDILSKYDPQHRKGFNLGISASAAGYNSMSNARHVHFGIDDAAAGEWVDCGRPGGKTHNSDALTVFEGDLYVGVTDAADEADWAHVFRYQGDQQWEDCGRVGAGRTRGVYAMIVHDGQLYAATSASHGPQPTTMDFGRVYRYLGGQHWEDIGQPGDNYRLNGLASYAGKLYVCGFNIGPDPGHCYVYEGGTKWTVCGTFEGWPHTLAVHDGQLYVAYPKGEVFSYDGSDWTNLGNPFGSLEECNQIHSLGVYRGELYAGSWPKGRIAALCDGAWADRGRLGDATEIIALVVYNGSFYAGTIPRAEVFRADQDRWTSIRRLFDPPGFDPVPVGSQDARGVADWSRVTSMTVFDGRLFASTGTCYRTMMEHPRANEIRGRVYAFSAGANVSYHHDIGAGWKHIAAVRDNQELRLYVDGQLSASTKADNTGLDISNDLPLQIGFGSTDFFGGKIRSVRLYTRVLSDSDVDALYRIRDDLENP